MRRKKVMSETRELEYPDTLMGGLLYRYPSKEGDGRIPRFTGWEVVKDDGSPHIKGSWIFDVGVEVPIVVPLSALPDSSEDDLNLAVIDGYLKIRDKMGKQGFPKQ
jgi:hypothetical protein